MTRRIAELPLARSLRRTALVPLFVVALAAAPAPASPSPATAPPNAAALPATFAPRTADHLEVAVEEGEEGLVLRLDGGSQLGPPLGVHPFLAGVPLEPLAPGTWEVPRFLLRSAGLAVGGTGTPGSPTATAVLGAPLVVQLVHAGNRVERGRFLLRRDGDAWSAEAVEPSVRMRTEGLSEVPAVGGAGRRIAAIAGASAGGDLVWVVHPRVRPRLRGLFEEAWEGLKRSADARGEVPDRSNLEARLGGRDRLWMLSPSNVRSSSVAARDLFANSPVYELDRGGLRDTGLSWYLSRIGPEPTPPRVADAVAVAGRLAASADRPRAVVLVTVAGVDGSSLSAQQARRVLDALAVPLVVWVPGDGVDPVADTWPEAVPLPTLGHLQREVSRLRGRLRKQRVEWWRGGEERGAP